MLLSYRLIKRHRPDHSTLLVIMVFPQNQSKIHDCQVLLAELFVVCVNLTFINHAVARMTGNVILGLYVE